CMDRNIISVFPIAGFDKELAYRLPDQLAGRVEIGSLVRVPVRNTLVLAVVSRFDRHDSYPAAKLKQVKELVQEEPVLPQDLISLGRWMQSYYAAPLEAILERMIPAPVRRGGQAKQEAWIRV